MIAYGFPIMCTPTGDVLGLCVLESGETLGRWISSDLIFLESDLKRLADGHEYRFLEDKAHLPSKVISGMKVWERAAAQEEKYERYRTALEEIIALHDNESTATTCCKMVEIAWEALKDYEASHQGRKEA